MFAVAITSPHGARKPAVAEVIEVRQGKHGDWRGKWWGRTRKVNNHSVILTPLAAPTPRGALMLARVRIANLEQGEKETAEAFEARKVRCTDALDELDAEMAEAAG